MRAMIAILMLFPALALAQAAEPVQYQQPDRERRSPRRT